MTTVDVGSDGGGPSSAQGRGAATTLHDEMTEHLGHDKTVPASWRSNDGSFLLPDSIFDLLPVVQQAHCLTPSAHESLRWHLDRMIGGSSHRHRGEQVARVDAGSFGQRTTRIRTYGNQMAKNANRDVVRHVERERYLAAIHEQP